MAEITDFGLIVLAVSGFLALAVFTNKLSERFPIPAPAIFLLAAALAARLSPKLGDKLSIQDVERVAVVALIAILFDGGIRIGWRRFPGRGRPDLAARDAEHVRHGCADRRRGPLAVRLLVDDRGHARRRARSDRSRP